MDGKNLSHALFALALLGGFAAPAPASSVDERDPRYQQMMFHLSNARAALAQAAEEFRKAQANNVLPGFRIDLMRGEAEQLAEDLDFYLVPRDRELEYRQLQPDDLYFRKPAALSDDTHPSGGN